MSKTTKKSTKSKIPSNVCDITNESEYFENSPKITKPQKKRPNEALVEDVDMQKLILMYPNNAKKNKVKEEKSSDECKESRQKFLGVLENQLNARKQSNSNLLKNLHDVVTHLEADHEALKANEQKLEHIAEILLKCNKQASTAQKQKFKALKDIHANYKIEVEGLLTRGAMKPDDRPLWFDVYKAFPPITEPKFARPNLQIEPVKQIFYHEDVIRAKFHSQGHGYGAVNMLNPVGETHTKRLVKQYEKLKAEGIPESELVEKSIATADSERPQTTEAPKITPKNPDSVTAQVLADADLKNIFKDEK